MKSFKGKIIAAKDNLTAMDKKGQQGVLAGLLGAGLTLVVLAIGLGYGAKILTDVGTGLTGDASAAVANGTKAISNMASNTPTLGTILVVGAVISVLVGAFAFVLGRNR